MQLREASVITEADIVQPIKQRRVAATFLMTRLRRGGSTFGMLTRENFQYETPLWLGKSYVPKQ